MNPKKADAGKGTLWHEKDGDFNPGWAIIIWYALALGTVLNVAAVVVSGRNEKAWPALGAAMVFDLMIVVAAAIGVYKLGRAKLIANSRVLAAGAKAIGDAARPAFVPNEWEHGDPQAGDL